MTGIDSRNIRSVNMNWENVECCRMSTRRTIEKKKNCIKTTICFTFFVYFTSFSLHFHFGNLKMVSSRRFVHWKHIVHYAHRLASFFPPFIFNCYMKIGANTNSNVSIDCLNYFIYAIICKYLNDKNLLTKNFFRFTFEWPTV